MLALRRHAQDVLHRNKTQNGVASTLAGKVAELNLGQYDPELLKLAVRHAVNPAEAASYLREIQVRLQILDGQPVLLLPIALIPSNPREINLRRGQCSWLEAQRKPDIQPQAMAQPYCLKSTSDGLEYLAAGPAMSQAGK